MNIEEVRIEDLSFADYNPRRMMRHEAEALKRSLDEYGVVEPAVVNLRTPEKGWPADSSKTIVGGHMRVSAALELGRETFPTFYVDLDAPREKALNLALNRISGEWDEDKLAEVIYGLSENGDEELMALTGFDAPELEKILDEVAGPEPEPAVPAEAEWDVEPGDVWQVGRHFLACGDSADASALTRLMAKAGHDHFDLIFTSPPYNVGMDYGEHDDSVKDWTTYGGFLKSVVSVWLDRLDEGRAVCWQIGDAPSVYPFRQVAMLEDELGLSYFRTMIWDKVGIGVPLWYMTERERKARYFTPDYQHEPIYLLSKGKLEVGPELDRVDAGVSHSLVRVASATSTRDVPNAAGDRTRYGGLDRHGHKVHQAVYPAKLVQGFATMLTAPGEVVADPFMGVGSTMIAAERADRASVGMELDPDYCAIALERFAQTFEIEPERVYRKRKSKAEAEKAAA